MLPTPTRGVIPLAVRASLRWLGGGARDSATRLKAGTVERPTTDSDTATIRRMRGVAVARRAPPRDERDKIGLKNTDYGNRMVEGVST